jgi:DNA replicative helicase MCM subunit Mcm2 (Cdc46/Mcm family)
MYTNYQEVLVQESATNGAAPRALDVLLLDDLAGCCQVGDEVMVTGVVIRRFRAIFPGAKSQVGSCMCLRYLSWVGLFWVH